MYQGIQKVSLNICVIAQNDSPIGQRLIFFLKTDLENFLPIAGLFSLPCYSFYNSPRCAAKMTLVILLPSPTCSPNLWGFFLDQELKFIFFLVSWRNKNPDLWTETKPPRLGDGTYFGVVTFLPDPRKPPRGSVGSHWPLRSTQGTRDPEKAGILLPTGFPKTRPKGEQRTFEKTWLHNRFGEGFRFNR